MSGEGYFWPVWVLGGWGLGLAFSGYAAYGHHGVIGDADVDREMTRLRSS